MQIPVRGSSRSQCTQYRRRRRRLRTHSFRAFQNGPSCSVQGKSSRLDIRLGCLGSWDALEFFICQRSPMYTWTIVLVTGSGSTIYRAASNVPIAKYSRELQSLVMSLHLARPPTIGGVRRVLANQCWEDKRCCMHRSGSGRIHFTGITDVDQDGLLQQASRVVRNLPWVK